MFTHYDRYAVFAKLHKFGKAAKAVVSWLVHVFN